MSNCASCGEELEYGAKFCTKCGSKVDSSNTETIEKAVHGATSIIKRILILLVLIFVGFFVFSIIKAVISLIFMLLIQYQVVDLSVYYKFKSAFVLLSMILAIFITPKITDLKTIKAKIIVAVLIVVFGTISAVWISTSNIMNRFVPSALTDTSFKKSTEKFNMILQECKKIRVFDVAKNETRDLTEYSKIEIYDKNKVLIYIGHGTKPNYKFTYAYSLGEGTQFITDTYKSANLFLTSWYEKHYDTRLISIRKYDNNTNIINDITFKDCKPLSKGRR